MRWVAALLLAGISLSAATDNVMHVAFTDAQGGRYNTATLSEDLARAQPHLGYSFPHTALLLIETPNLQDVQFLKQETILNKMNGEFEDLQLVEVLACSGSEDHDGYYVAKSDAQVLMGPGGKFRVSLLDSSGHVLSRQSKPFIEQDLRRLLKR